MLESFYKDLPVTVTGGAGFIGSTLVRRLLALGARVTVVDDFSSGSSEALEDVMHAIRFICGSIEDEAVCQAALDGAHILFHLAAIVSVPDSMIDPLRCNQVNVAGTSLLLEIARRYQLKNFIFSSSAAVYGNYDGICHEDLVCAPLSPYGYSKWLGELLCREYFTVYGLPSVCLRYFNVYALPLPPYARTSGFVARVWNALRVGEPVQLYGDGSATRDFISVDEVVEANLRAGALPKEHCVGQPINVASGISITLREMVVRVAEALEKHEPTQFAFLPARKGDIVHSRADCNRYIHLKQKFYFLS